MSVVRNNKKGYCGALINYLEWKNARNTISKKTVFKAEIKTTGR
jgi:hypothetical protein